MLADDNIANYRGVVGADWINRSTSKNLIKTLGSGSHFGKPGASGKSWRTGKH